MSDAPASLAEFLLETPPAAGARPLLEKAGLADLRGRIGGVPGIEWSAAADTVADAIGAALDVKASDLLVGAWGKLKELQPYLDAKRHPPGETALVPLMKHELRSIHHPTVEVLAGETVLAKLTFDVELSLSLEGVVLKIRDGGIFGVGGGSCSGHGILKLAGSVLAEKHTPKYSLPGTLHFTESIPIPRLPPGA